MSYCAPATGSLTPLGSFTVSVSVTSSPGCASTSLSTHMIAPVGSVTVVTVVVEVDTVVVTVVVVVDSVVVVSVDDVVVGSEDDVVVDSVVVVVDSVVVVSVEDVVVGSENDVVVVVVGGTLIMILPLTSSTLSVISFPFVSLM